MSQGRTPGEPSSRVGFKLLDNPTELRRLLAEGFTTRDIAQRSGWSEHRVVERLAEHGIECPNPWSDTSPGYW